VPESVPSTDKYESVANVVAQSYVFKGVMFAFIMAMVAWYIKRSRSGYSSLKSSA